MFPYKTILSVDKASDTPVYVQLANCFAREIRNGILKPGTRLPGARILAELIRLNRNTITAVYEELTMQGYLEMHPRRGAFISHRIPDIAPKPISRRTRNIAYPETAGFSISKVGVTYPKPLMPTGLTFNDGLPDERIAPLQELSRAYRRVLNRGSRVQFGYSDPAGNPELRKQLSAYLNESRGFQTTSDEVLITRGSQMAIYLVSRLLLSKGDTVVIGKPDYRAAAEVFVQCGANLLELPVDERGLDVDRLEQYCKRRKIRAVYVTPHHHFPTTVTLSPCRRIKLLALAEKFGFAILEDEYDYEFHYKSSPILPLATADNKGMVISFGSLSKSISPALRIGYVVAPANVIHELAKIRSIVDRQGDFLLEQAMAELFKEGTIKRHLRKALNVYRERRDHLGDQLRKTFPKQISFRIPEGGLACWVTFDKRIPLDQVAGIALKNGLQIDHPGRYNSGGIDFNATRLGFASLNPKEIDKAIAILNDAVLKVRKQN